MGANIVGKAQRSWALIFLVTQNVCEILSNFVDSVQIIKRKRIPGADWVSGPAAAAAVGFLNVAVDVEVPPLGDRRHGDVLVGLPQEASSSKQ